MVTFDQFKVVLADPSARASLGIELSDQQAATLLLNDAQAIAYYEQWSRPRPQKRWDGVAVSGFILTIIGTLFATAGRFIVVDFLLLGIGLLSSHLSTRTRYRGRGLAIAGIAIGWCGVAIALRLLLSR